MNKHTPGPWSYRRKGSSQEWEIDSGYCPILDHQSWKGLAVIYGCDDDKKNGSIVGDANARLIAAAPELLEALEELLAETWINGAFADKARAAIAKAKGETK